MVRADELNVFELIKDNGLAFFSSMVPKGGFEPPLPEGNCALNAARLPFRHFGTRVVEITMIQRPGPAFNSASFVGESVLLPNRR